MATAMSLFSSLFSMKSEISYGTTMVVSYFKKGEISRSGDLFDQMELDGKRKEKVSWYSMISGYVNNLTFAEAFAVFRDLVNQDVFDEAFAEAFDVEVDGHTLGTGILAGLMENDHNELRHAKLEVEACGIYTVRIILPACSRLATIERDKQAHARVIRCGY